MRWNPYYVEGVPINWVRTLVAYCDLSCACISYDEAFLITSIKTDLKSGTVPWRHMGVWRYSSTIPELDTNRWREGSDWRPGEIAPGTKEPGWARELVWVLWREKSYPCRETNLGCAARRYTDWAIPAPMKPIRTKIKSVLCEVQCRSPKYRI
jgi:hypothetical protein